MKRVRRKLYTLAAGALCVAACVMWARSHTATDTVSRYTASHYFEFVSGDGLAAVRVTSYPWPLPRDPAENRLAFASGPPGDLGPQRGPTFLNRLGFRFAQFGPPGGGYRLRVVTLPWWSVALAAAILAALTRATRRRPAPGHCATCGYDLRATPGRCPECGTVAGPVEGAA